MRGPTGGAHVGGLERVEPAGGLGVGDPAAADDAASGLDVGEQELLPAVAAGVLYDTQTNASKTSGAIEFHRRSEQHLAQRAPAGDARFGTTQEGLVDLHVTGESVSTRAHHDRPVAMQHGPGSLVGAKLHLTPKLGRADAALPAGEVPGSGEPNRQRRPSAVEDRACGGGHARIAAGAAPSPIRCPPALGRATPRAYEAPRPAQPVEVVQALPVLIDQARSSA